MKNSNITLKSAVKTENGGVSAVIAFPNGVKVRDAVIVKNDEGSIFALPPQADGKYNYITWDRDEAAKLAAEAVITESYRPFKTPVATSIGSKIGFVDLELTTPVEIRVFVNKTQDGTPKLRLPGRSYTSKNEDGTEKKGVSFYVYISREDDAELAAAAVAMAEAE